jgi:hypothetical protein
MTIKTPLYNGWNVIAVPYNTTAVPATNFFASPVSAIYEWLPSGTSAESSSTQYGSYATRTTLEPGKGYFVKASNASTLQMYTGQQVTGSVTVTLNPGWTMIANPHISNMTDIATNWLIDGGPLSAYITGNVIAGSIYYWNGSAYDSWSIIGNHPQSEPWKGYGLLNLTNSSHTLTIQ